jgi:hypothetical protein
MHQGLQAVPQELVSKHAVSLFGLLTACAHIVQECMGDQSLQQQDMATACCPAKRRCLLCVTLPQMLC